MTEVAELREVVFEAREDRAAWEHLVRHERDERVCERRRVTDSTRRVRG